MADEEQECNMKRRDAVKKGAVSAAVVAIGATPALARVTLPFDYLKVYDPTLDLDATPNFVPNEEVESFLADFVPTNRIDHFGSNGQSRQMVLVDDPKAEDGSVILDDAPSVGVRQLSAKEVRPLLNGRPFRGGIEGSVRGGWVRFLAMRPTENGKPMPYSNLTRDPEGEPGAVTGIAFGVVSWMVHKDVKFHEDE